MTPKKLKTLIDKFFTTEESLTVTKSHLYAYLELSYPDSLVLKQDTKMRKLLEQAERTLEINVINKGFLEDKSFAKWYIERYHQPETLQQTSSNTTVNIVLDNKPGHE